MSRITPERLSEIAVWVSELSAEEIAFAAQGVTLRRLEKGAHLFHSGDKFDYWAGVISGLLKMSAVSSSGKSVTYTGVGNGGWFGEGSMIKDESRLYDIVAMRDCEIALMNRATFQSLMQNSAGFNRFLVRLINERLGNFISMVGSDRMLGATGRVARSIKWLFNPVLSPGLENSIIITQEELGNLAGISRQATNRAVQELVSAGLIAIEGDRMTALDLHGLSVYGD